MIESLFPLGLYRYVAGALLLASGIALIYISSSRIPGASTFLETAISFISDRKVFRESPRAWRILFTAGIVLGASLYAVFYQDGFWRTDVSLWRLLVGGILVGFGTRFGKGCTSGHGMNGIGSLSKASIVNFVFFLFTAVITALTVQALGVTP